MTKQEIGREIKELALEVLDVELSGEENLSESGVDSLSLVELLAGIVNKFNICFGEDDLQPETLVTLDDLVRITEKRL